jgi:hypothetical protein
VSYFARNSEWNIFWDDKSMLFLKDIPKFKDVINKYEYRVNPTSFVSRSEYNARV